MIYLNDHTENLNIEAALAEVSEQRRAQALRFSHGSGRRLCLAAYLLLKKGLQEEYGITENPIFEYAEDGKPSIVGHPDLFFNLSHSGNVALCALDTQPIGADVEVHRRVRPGLMAYTMNETELAAIQASADVEKTFLEYWTRKEAVLKLTGEGIRSDLKEVLRDTERYRIDTIKAANYIYSVARYCKLP